MKVGEVCNRVVTVIRADESARAAAVLMREHHVGDVVVVRGEVGERTPVGIVTDRDLVVEIIAKDTDVESVTAGDLVTRDLVIAHENEELSMLLGRMRHLRIRRVPVVDEGGILVGILTLDDTLELLAEQLRDVATLVSRQPEAEAALRG